MRSVWCLVDVVSPGGGGGGGGIGCRETTIAPLWPTVTQRTFEMNYFIANCAVPCLCGLQVYTLTKTAQHYRLNWRQN